MNYSKHSSKPSKSQQQKKQQLERIMENPPNFATTNSLIFRSTPPSHKICQLIKKQQNIELILIVLSKNKSITTKKADVITQCLVADKSGCMFMNFYNEIGIKINEGDILYASGIYASHYKQMLVLYQGSQSIIKRLGKYFFEFDSRRNMSLQSLQSQVHEPMISQKNYRN